jgi:hypothetical protein
VCTIRRLGIHQPNSIKFKLNTMQYLEYVSIWSIFNELKRKIISVSVCNMITFMISDLYVHLLGIKVKLAMNGFAKKYMNSIQQHPSTCIPSVCVYGSSL